MKVVLLFLSLILIRIARYVIRWPFLRVIARGVNPRDSQFPALESRRYYYLLINLYYY